MVCKILTENLEPVLWEWYSPVSGPKGNKWPDVLADMKKEIQNKTLLLEPVLLKKVSVKLLWWFFGFEAVKK